MQLQPNDKCLNRNVYSALEMQSGLDVKRAEGKSTKDREERGQDGQTSNLGKVTQMGQGTLLSSPHQIPFVTKSRLQEDTLCFLNLFSWAIFKYA